VAYDAFFGVITRLSNDIEQVLLERDSGLGEAIRIGIDRLQIGLQLPTQFRLTNIEESCRVSLTKVTRWHTTSTSKAAEAYPEPSTPGNR